LQTIQQVVDSHLQALEASRTGAAKPFAILHLRSEERCMAMSMFLAGAASYGFMAFLWLFDGFSMFFLNVIRK